MIPKLHEWLISGQRFDDFWYKDSDGVTVTENRFLDVNFDEFLVKDDHNLFIDHLHKIAINTVTKVL